MASIKPIACVHTCSFVFALLSKCSKHPGGTAMEMPPGVFPSVVIYWKNIFRWDFFPIFFVFQLQRKPIAKHIFYVFMALSLMRKRRKNYRKKLYLQKKKTKNITRQFTWYVMCIVYIRFSAWCNGVMRMEIGERNIEAGVDFFFSVVVYLLTLLCFGSLV